ncbi:OmpP1/FadL family transporter [Paraliomyxa miuraensis]|uniref:OmpP1/FadL family transporter n=1 Tax=Paraliomyxa miuraensis TaxID=376150 RepID=UPI00224F2AE1|nr:outer membrane protein transport protein [Paraliomyxa miuraensis]MCX4245348.1 outer membrane protein transport protein [Paraliomyxa miuraensis]
MTKAFRGLDLLATAVLLAAVAHASPAAASGFDAPALSHGQSSPVVRDAAAVHYNPGQLGYIDRTELDLGLGLIFGSIGYQRDRRGQYQYADNFAFAEPIDPADIDPSRTGVTQPVRATPVGPILDGFLALPVADRVTLGAGFYIPYAAILSLPHDGDQRFQAQSVTLISTHTTISAGFRLHDVISIGGGVSYVLSILQLSKVQDFAAVQSFADGLASPPISQANDLGPSAPSTVRELDLLARQADIGPALSHGVSFNAGIALRPTKKLDVALVYQHGSRMRLNGDFTLNMDDDFFTQDLAAQGLQFPPVVQGKAHIELSLPKRLTLGLGYQVAPRVSLDGSVSYVFYSDFDVIDITLSSPDLAQPALGIGESVPQDLVRNWKNTVHGDLNVRVQATDKLRLSGSFGYQSGASPDSTVDMASPDGHRLLGGVGMEYALRERVSLLGDIRAQGIIPRTVTESDFDLGNGTYKMFLGVAAIHAKIKFGAGPGKRKRKVSVGGEGDAEATETETAEAEGTTEEPPASTDEVGPEPLEPPAPEGADAEPPRPPVPPPPPA